MKSWRGQPNNWTWKSSRTEKGRLWLGLGGAFYVMAALAFFSPFNSPATGRWAWLHNVFNKLGPNGDIILYAVAGTSCLIAGLQYLRSPK